MSDSSPPRPSTVALATLQEDSEALPPGTRLGEFEIREMIGAGGFGIVYRAWDLALERDVALKEYMPASMAGRGIDARVTLRSRSYEENFTLGLRSFVNEARLLARFDHPALVKVYRFWEANGTAYMVMPLYRARSLRELRLDMGAQWPDEAWLRAMIEPVLGALELIHHADVYHRDIAPDNILWCEDGRPVLLDFGAARHVLADRTQTLTAILKPQFAPIEQYADAQSLRQGPWTDLFALASTCYFLLAGRPPLPATARVLDDELTPLARLAPAGFSSRLLATLDWAMAVRPQGRPQSVATFRDAMNGKIEVPLRTGSGITAPLPAVAPSDSAAFERTLKLSPSTSTTPPSSRSGESVDTTTNEASRWPATLLERPDVIPAPRPRRAGWPIRSLALGALVVALGGVAWLTQSHPKAATPSAMPGGDRTSPPALTGTAVTSPAPAETPPAVATEVPASAASPVSRAAALAAGGRRHSLAAREKQGGSRPTSASRRVARSDPATSARLDPVKADLAAQASQTVIASVHGSETTSSPSLPLASPTNASADSAVTASSAVRGPGPREICVDIDPSTVGACVKRLCDDERRFQRFPACVRLHRQKEAQKQLGESE